MEKKGTATHNSISMFLLNELIQAQSRYAYPAIHSVYYIAKKKEEELSRFVTFESEFVCLACV